MNVFIIGFFVISVIGTLLHFTYDLSNHNKYIALISAVNESTWEHIKMGLTAFFMWSMVDGFFLFNNPNYFLSKLVGSLTIIIIIPLLFYGYKFLLKRSVLIFDILIFYIAIFLAQLFSYLVISSNSLGSFVSFISLIFLVLLFGFYVLATFFPLKNYIFLDPISKKYGIKAHFHKK